MDIPDTLPQCKPITLEKSLEIQSQQQLQPNHLINLDNSLIGKTKPFQFLHSINLNNKIIKY